MTTTIETPESTTPAVREAASSHYSIAPDTKEVRQWSETEAAGEKGLQKTLVYAEVLEDRWNERVAREGTVVWVNPFEPRNKQTTYATPEECQAAMDAGYKMQIEAAKLTKEPEHAWTPQKKILSPKRTIEDVVPPAQAKMMKAAMEAAKDNTPSTPAKGGPRTTSVDELTANRVLKMPDHEAVERIGELSARELQRLVHLAEAYGKRKIMKEAKAKLAAAN